MSEIKVLFVDDEEDLLHATKLYFAHNFPNIKLITAHSAKEAFNKLESNTIDVIVSDYQLQITDGLEFLKEIRTSKYNLPFIIFSGKGREEIIIKALNLGADYYVQKGGDLQSQFRELLNLIEKSIEKKKAEIALRISEEKFSKAFKYSPNNIVIIRLTDHLIIDVNDVFFNTLNYEKNELMGKNIKDLKIWAKQEDFDLCIKEVLEAGSIKDFEILVITKDSQIIPLQISASLIDIEGALCILLVGVDLSQIKLMLTKLSESELQYKFLFNESPISMVNLDLFELKTFFDNLSKKSVKKISKEINDNPKFLKELTTKIKFKAINKRAIKILHLQSESEIKKLFESTFIDTNLILYKTIFTQLLNGKTFFETELPIFTLKNEKLFVFTRVLIPPGCEKDWSQIFLSFLDITEREKLEETLKIERLVFKMVAETSLKSKNISELCDNILKFLVDMMQYDFGTLRILELKEKKLLPISIYGINKKHINLIKPIDAKGSEHKLISRLHKGEILFYSNAINSEDFKDSILIHTLKVQSYIFCPLIGSSGEELGSIQIGSHSIKDFTESDKIFFESIAKMLSFILQQKNLKNN